MTRSEMEASFLLVLDETSHLLKEAYEKAGLIDDEHALAQAGLKDGSTIVMDYLHHNEAGVAFDHLMYMINEAQLSLSPASQRVLERIEVQLGSTLSNGQ